MRIMNYRDDCDENDSDANKLLNGDENALSFRTILVDFQESFPNTHITNNSKLLVVQNHCKEHTLAKIAHANL